MSKIQTIFVLHSEPGGMHTVNLSGFITLESQTLSCQCEKTALLRPNPTTPQIDCLCALFTVIAKRTLTGISDLVYRWIGKPLSSRPQSISGRAGILTALWSVNSSNMWRLWWPAFAIHQVPLTWPLYGSNLEPTFTVILWSAGLIQLSQYLAFELYIRDHLF